MTIGNKDTVIGHNETTPHRVRWSSLAMMSLLFLVLVLATACGGGSQQIPSGMTVKNTSTPASEEEIVDSDTESTATEEESAATEVADADSTDTEETDTEAEAETTEAEAETEVETTEAEAETEVETTEAEAEVEAATAEAEAEAAEAEAATTEADTEAEDADAESEAATAEAEAEAEDVDAEAEAATAEADTEAETETAETETDAEGDSDESTDEESSESETMETVIEETRHFKGDPDAPVTIIEFSDFQCPHCSNFASETGPQIDEEFVDSGIVRFGYRHAAYQGEGSQLAAEATECAADQDAFWEYHDRLIERLAVEGKRDFTYETLKQFATELQLDSKLFDSCLETGKYTSLVEEETNQSMSSYGVSGTPTFLVNGRRLVGAQPFDAFAQVITEVQENGESDPSDQTIERDEDEEPPMNADEFMDMLIEETRHFKGDADAPITIIEFSDFQCPYCSKFAVESGGKIDEEYVEEGIVRFGYIHAAYHQGEAYLAAEASECAADQDAFWQYHDLLIDQLAVAGESSFPAETLKQYAADLDLDTDEFDACLDDGTYSDKVREQTQFSQYIGVSGTPTFVINGKGLVGAQPFEVFEQIITEELGE